MKLVIKSLPVLLAAPFIALGLSSASAETLADLHKSIDAAHAETQKHHADADKHLAELAKHSHAAADLKMHTDRRVKRDAERNALQTKHVAQKCGTVDACKKHLAELHAVRDRAQKHNAEILAHLKRHNETAELHKKIAAAHAETQKHHADADKHLAEMAKAKHLTDNYKTHLARREKRGAEGKTHEAAHKAAACATPEECNRQLAEIHAVRDRAAKHNAEMLAALKIPAPAVPPKK